MPETNPRIKEAAATYTEAITRVCQVHGHSVSDRILRYEDDLIRCERRLNDQGQTETVLWLQGHPLDEPLFLQAESRVKQFNHDYQAAQRLHELVMGEQHE